MREVEEEERHRSRSPARDEHKVSSGDGPRARHACSRAGRRDARRMGAGGRDAREPVGRGGRDGCMALRRRPRGARGPTCCAHAARVQGAPVPRRGSDSPSFDRCQRGRLRR